MGKYDDIINLPHHVSNTRPHMSINDRAAQFSPFAALVGHSEAIEETARLTQREADLAEDAIEGFNQKLLYIKEHLADNPQVSITYFEEDRLKSGGRYLSINGSVKKIDEYARVLVMDEGTVIPMRHIVDIEVL